MFPSVTNTQVPLPPPLCPGFPDPFQAPGSHPSIRPPPPMLRRRLQPASDLVPHDIRQELPVHHHGKASGLSSPTSTSSMMDSNRGASETRVVVGNRMLRSQGPPSSSPSLSPPSATSSGRHSDPRPPSHTPQSPDTPPWGLSNLAEEHEFLA